MNKRYCLVLLMVCLMAGPTLAQQLQRVDGSTNPRSYVEIPADDRPVPPAAVYTITHSVDPATIENTSIACANGSITTDNSYLRLFDIDGEFALLEPFDVLAVQFGVQTATAGSLFPSGEQPVGLYAYRLAEGSAFTFANMEFLGGVNLSVSDGTSTLFSLITMPAGISITDGYDLVIEIYT